MSCFPAALLMLSNAGVGAEVTVEHMTNEHRLELAVDLAEALADGVCEDLQSFSDHADTTLERNAHGWEEIQTVLAAHRAGKPTVPQRSTHSTRASRPEMRRPRRANMYEPDLDTDIEPTDTDEDRGVDPHEFTYAAVGITNSARTAFDGEDIELLILLGCAVRHGEYQPGRDGAHKFRFREHYFVVSEDGGTVIAYAQRENRPRERRADDTPVEAVTLDATSFHPDTVSIKRNVLFAFGNKHGVDDDEAEEEIRAFLEWALQANKHRTLKNGCHLFDYRGFKVWVSPDGAEVSKYETLHIERTPIDVRDGVPSRFARRQA